MNSISQLMIIVVGTTIKWGPHIPLSQANEANIDIVYIVLPNPISSANIPLSFLLCKVTSQSSPIIWYSLRSPYRRNGTLVLTFALDSVNPVGCKALAISTVYSAIRVLDICLSSFYWERTCECIYCIFSNSSSTSYFPSLSFTTVTLIFYLLYGCNSMSLLLLISLIFSISF